MYHLGDDFEVIDREADRRIEMRDLHGFACTQSVKIPNEIVRLRVEEEGAGFVVAVGFASAMKFVPATRCWPAINPPPKPDAEKLKLSSATAKSLMVSPPSAAD